MYSLGMDLGTSTVKIVLMQNGTVEKYWLAVHHGRPLLCLRQGLSELAIGRDETLAVCVTGDNAGALLERCPVLSELGEIPAIVEGMEAEERGQGEAIARNLYEMSALKVPVLCIMIGEGGSGGALALAVGNEVWMMENATYCVLSPEGFASILWKDGKRAKEASEIMKITALDLKSLGVIEQIIPEYGVADAKACESISRYLKGNIKKFLEKQNGKTGEQFASERYARFRKF